MMYNNRRSLFALPTRRKLFSSDTVDALETIKVKCQDCGYVTEIAGSPTSAICPECGGTRFSPVLSVFSPDNVPESIPEEGEKTRTYSERISLFNEEDPYSDETRFFSEPDSDVERFFSDYGGCTLSKEDCESATGMNADQIVEKGFGEYSDDNNITISEDSYLKSKLFSKIVVTITKVLDLNPRITADMDDCKSDVIDSLERSGEICPKGILLIRKAHGIIPTNSHIDCCEDAMPMPCDSSQEWLRDSGILGDLKLEFGGLTKPSSEFSTILGSRYPDAPSNILDLLKNSGVIRIGGGNISILR